MWRTPLDFPASFGLFGWARASRGINCSGTRVRHVVRHHDENQNDHDDGDESRRLTQALDLPQPSPGG